MNNVLKSLSLLSLTLLVTSCGSVTSSTNGNGSSYEEQEPFELASNVAINKEQFFRVKSPKECTQTNKNRFIYQVMGDSYLWANTTPELDYSDTVTYSTSEKMLKALKSEHDKFSFILDAKTSQSFFEEGKNSDFGVGLQTTRIDSNTTGLVIQFVYANSPADKLGVKRGDIVTKIDEKLINEENWSDIVGRLTKHESVKFTFLRQDGTTEDKILTKDSYSIDTILYSSILANENQSKRIGYMVFQDFIKSANGQIDAEFNKFKQANVNELILDLRYNGGGYVYVANHLASLIGGSNVSENIFSKTMLNERYSRYNETSYFEKYNVNALNLERVFVITTNATCSSSELVINSLKASANNVEVIQIGKPTCGKPYGYAGSGKVCDKALYVINEESKNGDDVGGYVDGITPKCEAKDNILKAFGDTEEDSLKEALYYITNNRCSVKKSKQTRVQKKLDLQLPKDGFKRIMSAY